MLNHLVTPISLVKTTFRINHFHAAACLLAGHSKWANIRHIKAQKDGDKGLLFSKYAHRMRLAIQEGGSADPKTNSALKSLIEEAIRKKMPNGTIQNVLKKYSDPAATKLTKFIWDLRVLGKVYMVISIQGENIAYTKQTAKQHLKKYNYAEISARNLFDEQGVIVVEVPEKLAALDANALEEKCTDDAIESGAEEVEVIDGDGKKSVVFTCSPNELNRVRGQLEKLGYIVESNEHLFIPKNTISLSEDDLQKLEQLKQKLGTVDGIQEIFDNVEYEQAQ